LQKHIAEIYPNAKLNLLSWWQLIVSRSQSRLYFRSAPDRFNCASGLCQNGIAGGVENPSPMRRHERFENLFVAAKREQSVLFVFSHQATVFRNIG